MEARTPWWRWHRPALTPAAVVFDLTTASTYAAIAVPIQASAIAGSVVVPCLLAAAVAVRRLAWPAMVALALAAALIQVISGELVLLPNAAYLGLFATLGCHREARVRWFGLASALVATVVAGVWMAFQQPGDKAAADSTVIAGGFAAVAALFTLGGWTAGFVWWQRRQSTLAQFERRVEEVERRHLRAAYDQELERSQIAADMHDVVAHSWAVVAAQADGARYRLHTAPQETEQALAVIGATARSAMVDVRRLLERLRQSQTEAGPLVLDRRSQILDRMREAGMDVQVQRVGTPRQADLAALTAQRILAEALTNALKHGDLSRPVRIEEDWRDGVELRVTNAVDPHAAAGQEVGHGIPGMTERARVAGGTLTAGREGSLWVVAARIPREQP